MAKAASRKFAKDEAKMRKYSDQEEDRMSSKPRKRKTRNGYKMGAKVAAGKRNKKVEHKHTMFK